MAIYTHFDSKSSPWANPRFKILAELKAQYQCKPIDKEYIKKLQEELKIVEQKYNKKKKNFKILKSTFNGTYKI